jgi:acetolactate synthase I/II/III large subunit
MYTASRALLDALVQHGVSHLFVNFGSDHAALIEAILEAHESGEAIPEIVTCPNEMVALSAAHGFWLASGVPQAVLVHVECGTQALAGAVHTADKGRAPVLIFAGMSPVTLHGELKGSRNEFAMWLQDVHDQRGIVRGYMRYDNEVRTGHNMKELVHRAFQFAMSDPKGPVYLMAPREVLEQEVAVHADDAALWRPIEPAALPISGVEEIGRALLEAERPLVVTSYIGRNPTAVAPLIDLCKRIGIGVHEACPSAMNFPHDNPLYQGNQWNQPVQNEALAEADVVLVIDSDVPWIPNNSRPASGARILHIDIDPLKQQMPHWRIAAARSYRADAETALLQLNGWLDSVEIDLAKVSSRSAFWQGVNAKRIERLAVLEARPEGYLTSEYAVSRFQRLLDDDMIVFNEGISNYHVVFDHLAVSKPGRIHTSGSGSLGWNGGAALGAKLARPDLTPVVFTGDGSYMFSIPETVHWMSRKYDAPFLTVIFNNRGWKSPKLSTLALYPEGRASQLARLDTSFEPAPDYGGIAVAAGGSWTVRIDTPDDLDAAFAEALRVVREDRRSAIVELVLAHH